MDLLQNFLSLLRFCKPFNQGVVKEKQRKTQIAHLAAKPSSCAMERTSKRRELEATAAADTSCEMERVSKRRKVEAPAAADPSCSVEHTPKRRKVLASKRRELETDAGGPSCAVERTPKRRKVEAPAADPTVVAGMLTACLVDYWVSTWPKTFDKYVSTIAPHQCIDCL